MSCRFDAAKKTIRIRNGSQQARGILLKNLLYQVFGKKFESKELLSVPIQFFAFQLSQYIFGPLLFLLSVFIILIILLQRGRGGGLTGALGGAGGSSAFGVKAGDIFTRITAISVLLWICLCAFVCWWYLPETLDIEADPNVTTTGAGALSIGPKEGESIPAPASSSPLPAAGSTPTLPPTTALPGANPATSTPPAENPAPAEQPPLNLPPANTPAAETPAAQPPAAETPASETPAPALPPAEQTPAPPATEIPATEPPAEPKP